MASKLVEWLTAIILFASIWSAFVFDMVPIELDPRIKEIIVPCTGPLSETTFRLLTPFLTKGGGLGDCTPVVSMFTHHGQAYKGWKECVACSKIFLRELPVYLVIVFGCFSLATIGYRVATFNDCEEAAASLKKEVEEARKDLTKKGFKFT